MELNKFASLQDIDSYAGEQIHVIPGPDVVLVGLDHLRDFPEALQRLQRHQAQDDWRVLNLTQVMMASKMVTHLVKLERRVARLGRAIQGTSAACGVLESASYKVHNSTCPGMVGMKGINLAVTNIMGRLDAASDDINKMLNGELAEANGRPWMSTREVIVLSDMKVALLRLRDTNHRVLRRLDRLERVVSRLERFQRPSAEEARHVLSSVDPELCKFAKPICISTRRLLNELVAGQGSVKDMLKLINKRQQKLTNKLDRVLGLNYNRFSGPLQVKSLRDLDEVFMVSTPHQGDVPARHVDVQLCGLNVLLDADSMALRVAEGVDQMGWTVQGLNALTTAQLDASLVTLRPALRHLRHVIDPLGVVLQPSLFNEVEQLAINTNKIMFDGHGSVVCAAAGELVKDVRDMVAKSTSLEPDHKLSLDVCKLVTILDLVRGGEVSFQET